jgi:competence protein ComEA
MPESRSGKLAIALVALLAGGLILAAVILLFRGDDNAPIRIVLPTLEATGTGQSDVKYTEITAAESELKVYIAGAVRYPGVYRLQPGDRLEDALAAAGGGAEEADLEAINLARRVEDEAYYHVPRLGETPRPPVAEAANPALGQGDSQENSTSSGGLVNLNTASADLLETLPGIGPVRAQAIVDDREQNGLFQSVEEVTRVPGIGSATYNAIHSLVTAGPEH